MDAERPRIEGPEGPYTITKTRVDSGAVRVHEATDAAGAAVLLTEVFVAAANDWDAVARFEREAKALATLAHPRIPRARFFAVGDPGAPTAMCVAQALPAGRRTLDVDLRSGRRFSSPDLEALFRDALTTLSELHALLPPIVHGAVHAGAIVATPSADALFVDLDLGTRALARRAEPTGAEAPELEGRGEATPASDVWSLAIVVASLAAGAPPDKLARDRLGRVIVPASVGPRLRPALEACLDPIPARRPTAAVALRMLGRGPGLAQRARRLGVRPAFAVALGAVLLASPFALRAVRAKRAPSPPPAPAAFVASGPAVCPAAPPPIDPPAPVDTTPPAPSPVERELEWDAVVESGSPGDPKPGTKCTLHATVSYARGGTAPPSCTMTLRCGYESPIESAAMQSCQIDEHSEPYRRFHYGARAVMRDDANRGGRLIVDTPAGRVRFAGGEGHDLTLRVDAASHATAGPKLLDTQRITRAIERRGKVSSVRGPGGPAVGATCTFAITPASGPEGNCAARLECGGRTIYQRAHARCEVCNGLPTSVTDDEDSPVDGNARLSFTRGERELTFGDDNAGESFAGTVELASDPLDLAWPPEGCATEE